MIPISDDNPTLRTPWVTIAVLGAMFASWIFVQGAGFSDFDLAASVCNFGLVPGELTGRALVGSGVPIGRDWSCVVDESAVNWATPVTSLFLHGSWGHILGNALFFWVFGNNVEDVLGRGRFLAFYVVCGLAASAAHVIIDPGSPIPTVGASGAISGVMGAYLLLFPRVRVRMLFWFIIFFRIFSVPAWLVLLWWFAMQLLSGLPDVLSPSPDLAGGVAVWAHIGGFAAGALLVRLFTDPRLVARRGAALAVWGGPVVHTMGSRITRLKPVSGFAAESAGAIVILTASKFGIPVSTTHTITGSIVGVGATGRLSAVRWGIAGRIVWAWVITIPSAALIAGMAYLALARLVAP